MVGFPDGGPSGVIRLVSNVKRLEDAVGIWQVECDSYQERLGRRA